MGQLWLEVTTQYIILIARWWYKRKRRNQISQFDEKRKEQIMEILKNPLP